MKKLIDCLVLVFCYCSKVCRTDDKAASQLLHLIRSLGGQVLDVARLRPHPDPLKKIDVKGNIMSLGLDHPILKKDEFATNMGYHGSGKFGFLESSRCFIVSQPARFTDLSMVDDLAKGQLDFACLYYPTLRPRYGFIDERGENEPSSKSVELVELKSILWANFFGPEYVEKYGRDFLLAAPGWKTEELDDGGILYVTRESFVDWWKSKPKEILDYFRQKAPNVKLYRSKGVNIDAF